MLVGGSNGTNDSVTLPRPLRPSGSLDPTASGVGGAVVTQPSVRAATWEPEAMALQAKLRVVVGGFCDTYQNGETGDSYYLLSRRYTSAGSLD